MQLYHAAASFQASGVSDTGTFRGDEHLKACQGCQLLHAEGMASTWLFGGPPTSFRVPEIHRTILFGPSILQCSQTAMFSYEIPRHLSFLDNSPLPTLSYNFCSFPRFPHV